MVHNIYIKEPDHTLSSPLSTLLHCLNVGDAKKLVVKKFDPINVALAPAFVKGQREKREAK